MDTVEMKDSGASADEREQHAREPESMEALLAQQASVGEKLAGKQVTWVKVIAVTKDSVLVDVGEKREGVVPLSEFVRTEVADKEASDKEEGNEPKSHGAPSVGQRVPVILIGARRDGITMLSHKKARAEIGWEAALKAHKERARVRGTVQSAIKGGFLVDVNGVSGFLPASLADLRPVRTPARMVHTGVRCYVIEIHESKKQIVLSRKAVLEEETAKRRAKLMTELRVGEIRIGRVVHAGASGLVVDIGGIEGLVKPADIAWTNPKASNFERGAKVRVKVLAKPTAQPTGQHTPPAQPAVGSAPAAQPAAAAAAPAVAAAKPEDISLGIKQLTANPADSLRKKYPLKAVVKGKIVESTPAGIKITLDDKAAAVCPLHESDPETTYKAGEPVSALVQGVNPTTFEIVVSINKYEDIRDRKRVAQYLKAPPPLTLGQLLSPEKED